MKDAEFNELLASVKEAGEVIKGKRKPARVTKVDMPNVKEIRCKLDVTQAVFSQMIGVNLRTLQNWEQGRRAPNGPAIALLKVAERNPKLVHEALQV